MFYGITDLATFVIGTIVIVLLPGPNSLYVMTLSAQRGVRAGYQAAAGIMVGDTIIMILSVTGVASLLRAYPALFVGLKMAGAAYLAWLGLGLLHASMRDWRKPVASAEDEAPKYTSLATPFRTALGISLINPKAILFFVSFFIQFVSPDYRWPALSFLILGVIVQFFSFTYLSALIFGGFHLAEAARRYRRAALLGMAVVGVVFVGFGVRLAGASLL